MSNELNAVSDSLSQPVTVCRPALPMDTPGVMELTRTIWDGHDYVPYVWEDWLAENEGMLAVAEYGGRVAGLGKLSRVEGGREDWWMQGLRVDPTLQGRGIAARLHDYLLAYFLDHLQGALRLSTSSARLPVQHLCERTGFLRIGEFISHMAPSLPGEAHAFQPLQADQAAQALAMLLESPMLAWSAGMAHLNWQFAAPNLARISLAVGRGSAFWWHSAAGERQGLLVHYQEDDEQGVYSMLGMHACPPGQLAQYLLDYRRLAAELGCARCYWHIPNQLQALQAAQSAGFGRDSENSMYLYERLMV